MATHSIQGVELLGPTAACGETLTLAGDADVDVEVMTSVPKDFAIDCEQHANWLVRKITAARKYAERVKEWAEQEQRRADREEHTLLFLFGRQLEDWARGEIEKLDGKRKSLNLPAGTVGFRSVRPALLIDDEHAVLRWAEENCPSAIATMQKLVKGELNRLFEQVGAVPPDGAHVQPGRESFFIR